MSSIQWHISNAASLLAENSRRVPQNFVADYLHGVRDCARIGHLNGNGITSSTHYMIGFNDALDTFQYMEKSIGEKMPRALKKDVYERLDFMLSE